MKNRPGRGAAVVERVDAWTLDAELNQPFTIATGSHAGVANVLVRVVLADGTRGYGECAPATHVSGETQAGTLKAVRALASAALGLSAGLGPVLARRFEEAAPGAPCARAGLETALADAALKRCGLPFWRYLGARRRSVRSDVTITLGPLERAGREAAFYSGCGIRVLKIKIGKDADEDVRRVLLIAQNAPRCELILDANQGYDAPTARRVWTALARRGLRLTLFEQPVPREDLAGLAALTRAGLPVCADESVRTLEEARRIVRLKAAPHINVKLMKSGLWNAVEIAAYARREGLGLMVGGMVESSIAMGASAHIAAAFEAEAVDLDTPLFFRKRAVRGLHPRKDGVYDLASVRGGMGAAPLKEPS